MKRSGAKDDTSSPNAFAVLMGSGGKKKKKRTSRFVLCPAGCGKYCADIEINKHLDKCIQMDKSLRPAEQETLSIQETDARTPEGGNHVIPRSSGRQMDEAMAPNGDKNQPTPAEPKAGPSMEAKEFPSNVFAQMMKRSMEVFTSAEASKLAQRFHLNADGTVSVMCYSTFPGLSQPENIKWSTAVQIRGNPKKPSGVELSGADKPFSDVELVVSSSIESAHKKPRLVARHSRLSVPVLKSILQKSIRRRKPLPAVRVAMELAEKSLGDLLRRLPIIILEDSTLHPSFALITWLMIAHSKDFEPCLLLLTKIMCCVYEIALCPWQDHLEESSPDSVHELCCASYHKPGIGYTIEDHETFVWAMLVRAQYGGMACDIRMLHSYAKVWKGRFVQWDVPVHIRKRLTDSVSGSSPEDQPRWTDLPKKLHQSAMRQSVLRVEPMCHQSIPSLTFTDITTQGIDFHCSSVIEDILYDHELVEQCYKRLGEVADSSSGVIDPIPDAIDQRRSWLEGIVKRCMWTYSAGINRRLSLTVLNHPTKPEKDKQLQSFWSTLLLPRTNAFAKRYVKERLVGNS